MRQYCGNTKEISEHSTKGIGRESSEIRGQIMCKGYPGHGRDLRNRRQLLLMMNCQDRIAKKIREAQHK
jgi:hypothetical protein